MQIDIINGPNLNLLGTRELQWYGQNSMDDILRQLESEFPEVKLSYRQSNAEAELIDFLHGSRADGILLNAGAYTHTSVALGDAVAAIQIPVVELHISNIYKREGFRASSYIAPHVRGHISGFGPQVYALGIRAFLK